MLLYYQISLRWEILECEANKMMTVSKQIPNMTTLSDLGSSALYSIATIFTAKKFPF
ncbi:hypothetical protein HO912_08345 [Streptococcus suis]|nr:hypothetical protein [Streptococcus suis]